VGGTVNNRSGKDDGKKAVAYQHIDENLRFSAGGGGGCNNFNLRFQDSSIKVGSGQVGWILVEEATVSPGGNVYVQVTADGATGVLSASISTTPSSTSTVKTILIGSSSAEGVVTQYACGPFAAQACRKWFASSAPFYELNLF